MATRTLTEIFILMRNNASQSRHIFSEQQVTDRMALVSHGEGDVIELRRHESRLPPVWSDTLEETQYLCARLRNKMRELDALHSQHLLRPTFDDSTDEEHQIEVLTEEISRMFGVAQRLITVIRQQCEPGSTRLEQRLSVNVTSSLVSSLQDLSSEFRRMQSNYLKKINSREERSRAYFDTGLFEEAVDDGGWGEVDARWSSGDQLVALEENTKMAELRESEVRHIVKSIVDLNEVFKDLAHMVVDQGTVLDRIDYNIEQTSVQVHQGYVQLQKADAYQRKNRKMICIFILAAITMFLTLLLIVVKT